MTKQELDSYGQSCVCVGCKSGYVTWWTCLTCGSTGCHKHQYFNGYTVRYCVVCCPQRFDLVKKKDLDKREERLT